jgi:flagellar biosynthesis protein FliP
MIVPVLAASTVRDLVGGGETLSASLRIVVILTLLTILPSIVLMTTSFLRISIVLSFVRRALGTQELPANQVIVGLSLFLTFMIMAPTWTEAWTQGIKPYLEYQKSEEDALTAIDRPVRQFMFAHMARTDLDLFLRLAGRQTDGAVKLQDVETHVVISAFMTSELKRAFKMGFLIYMPFLVIDLIVASVLISMGMLVLPPVLISMPFKILIFVLVDGWGLVIGKVAESFATG